MSIVYVVVCDYCGWKNAADAYDRVTQNKIAQGKVTCPWCNTGKLVLRQNSKRSK